MLHSFPCLDSMGAMTDLQQEEPIRGRPAAGGAGEQTYLFSSIRILRVSGLVRATSESRLK